MKIAFFGATAAALLAAADAASNVTTGRGSPGCGKRVPKTGGNDFTPMFDVDGVNRMFRTYTPSQYDKDTPQPLILAFHGTAKTQQSLTLQSQFSDKSVNRNMMVQYMTAYKGRWYGPSHAYPEADDLRYTEMALEHLMNNYCIDVDRVYLVGHTGGAGFANILACDPRFSRHFAGMALMAPTLYRDLDDDYCKHANVPMPILEVHGNNDGTSPYWGLPNRVVGATPAIPDWVRRWVRRNGCDPTPRKTKLVMGEDVLSDKYTCHGHFGFVEHIRAMRHGYNWMTKHDVLDISPIMISFLNSHIRPGNMSIPLDDKGNFTCLGGYTPPADWPGHANFTSSANSTIPGTSTSSGKRTATHSSTTHGSTAHSPPPHSTYGSTHTIPSGITSSTDSAQPGSSKETSTGYYDRPSYHRGG
ncbi:hypothetical protein LMH87_011159 [Akanthomyces muscarius]|uniref:feruloyl esterase n=1 Tax=Akanthomyces muscarius TaxID=2231603 RepID=A0A9W8QAR5_AKAMU|nr:hypothetical protein LMH87_011159 [Akanthomyces muscarius]KAJ4150407.1 hypothetical protein LMH87_011159 [Akanthomyces muscarius]